MNKGIKITRRPNTTGRVFSLGKRGDFVGFIFQPEYLVIWKYPIFDNGNKEYPLTF
jgi:hypothetical protein